MPKGWPVAPERAKETGDCDTELDIEADQDIQAMSLLELSQPHDMIMTILCTF